MKPNDIKYNFGKHYVKQPLTPFQKFYGDGFDEAFSEREIAIDSWNAALYIARERLQMYGETAAIELLEILYED